DKGLIAQKKAASPSVAIIYYSTYGHVKTLAEQIKKGLESTGVNVDLFQIPETLSPDVLKAMSAPDKPKDVMQLDLDFIKKLPEYDGLMFGMPTRFGMMPAQMKACFDATGQLWQSGALAGKLAATFVSTGTQQGGQETTHFTAITSLVHHGMAYVPLGYQAGGDGQFDVSEIHGGSPWGASTLAGGDGSRQPSELELKIAGKHGEVFGGAVKRSVAPAASREFKVAVVYYSMYGHIKKLADEMAASMKEDGVTVDLFQAPELLSEEVLKKMGAPAKPADAVMDHANVGKLADYDGLVFGVPTRFGSAAAQMKAMFDSTGSLWQSGALAGKLCATFTSTGTPNGGQESTHMTTLTNMVHHGMIYVPLGYQAGADAFDMTELHGGSPWGASTFAGPDGSRQPSAVELRIAKQQGKVFAAKVKQMRELRLYALHEAWTNDGFLQLARIGQGGRQWQVSGCEDDSCKDPKLGQLDDSCKDPKLGQLDDSCKDPKLGQLVCPRMLGMNNLGRQAGAGGTRQIHVAQPKNEASIPMAGKDCVKLENLSSCCPEKSHEEDVRGAGRGCKEVIFQIIPQINGDMPADQELEDDEDDLPDLVPGDCLALGSCPVDSAPAWEVCVLRLLVRKLPSLEAPVQGICHEHELLFEEPRRAAQKQIGYAWRTAVVLC
ncbi:unnamed protein product, partial [Effrenium voratum]